MYDTSKWMRLGPYNWIRRDNKPKPKPPSPTPDDGDDLPF